MGGCEFVRPCLFLPISAVRTKNVNPVTRCTFAWAFLLVKRVFSNPKTNLKQNLKLFDCIRSRALEFKKFLRFFKACRITKTPRQYFTNSKKSLVYIQNPTQQRFLHLPPFFLPSSSTYSFSHALFTAIFVSHAYFHQMNYLNLLFKSKFT